MHYCMIAIKIILFYCLEYFNDNKIFNHVYKSYKCLLGIKTRFYIVLILLHRIISFYVKDSLYP